MLEERRYRDAHKSGMFKQTPSEYAHNYYRYVGYILKNARYSTVYARLGLCEFTTLTSLLGKIHVQSKYARLTTTEAVVIIVVSKLSL